MIQTGAIDIIDEINRRANRIIAIIDQFIDLDHLEHDGAARIRSDVDPLLRSLEIQLKQLSHDAAKIFSEEIEIEFGDTVKATKAENYRFLASTKQSIFVEKTQHDKALSKKYRKISTRAGRVYFTSFNLQNIAQRYEEAEKSYKNQQAIIAFRVLTKISEESELIQEASEFFSNLDVLLSFSVVSRVEFSSKRIYSRPIFNKNDDLSLDEIRHPVIQNVQSEGCVPNTLNYNSGSKFSIICGPNMGGKSTLLRSTGINILLAHIGAFVCAKASSIPQIDAIITRCGASDYQTQGISTFFAEMIETKYMLNTCTKNSLVLIDELGRSTSSSEGFALVHGVIKYMKEKLDPYCLFSTHFHELSASISRTVAGGSSIKSYFMKSEKNGKNVSMKYKLVEGHMDTSFAINVLSATEYDTTLIDKIKAKTEAAENRIGEERQQEQKGNLQETLKKGSKIMMMMFILKEFESMKLRNQEQGQASIEFQEILNQQMKSWDK